MKKEIKEKEIKEKIMKILVQPFADKWHLTEKPANKFTDQILDLFEQELIEEIEKIRVKSHNKRKNCIANW